MRTYAIWHRIQTQWRRDGMGERTGLDYTAVEVYLRTVERVHPAKEWAEIWAGLQAMETAALYAWAQQQRDKAN